MRCAFVSAAAATTTRAVQGVCLSVARKCAQLVNISLARSIIADRRRPADDSGRRKRSNHDGVGIRRSAVVGNALAQFVVYLLYAFECF